jgi:hypothetical protein
MKEKGEENKNIERKGGKYGKKFILVKPKCYFSTIEILYLALLRIKKKIIRRGEERQRMTEGEMEKGEERRAKERREGEERRRGEKERREGEERRRGEKERRGERRGGEKGEKERRAERRRSREERGSAREMKKTEKEERKGVYCHLQSNFTSSCRTSNL